MIVGAVGKVISHVSSIALRLVLSNHCNSISCMSARLLWKAWRIDGFTAQISLSLYTLLYSDWLQSDWNSRSHPRLRAMPASCSALLDVVFVRQEIIFRRNLILKSLTNRSYSLHICRNHCTWRRMGDSRLHLRLPHCSCWRRICRSRVLTANRTSYKHAWCWSWLGSWASLKSDSENRELFQGNSSYQAMATFEIVPRQSVFAPHFYCKISISLGSRYGHGLKHHLMAWTGSVYVLSNISWCLIEYIFFLVEAVLYMCDFTFLDLVQW